MSLGDIIESVVDKFTGHDQDNDAQANETSADNTQDNGQNILPASQDPLGDPADNTTNAQDQQAGILPASEDPLGDPADDTSASDRQAGILPASADPLGDPADRR